MSGERLNFIFQKHKKLDGLVGNSNILFNISKTNNMKNQKVEVFSEKTYNFLLKKSEGIPQWRLRQSQEIMVFPELNSFIILWNTWGNRFLTHKIFKFIEIRSNLFYLWSLVMQWTKCRIKGHNNLSQVDNIRFLSTCFRIFWAWQYL